MHSSGLKTQISSLSQQTIHTQAGNEVDEWEKMGMNHAT